MKKQPHPKTKIKKNRRAIHVPKEMVRDLSKEQISKAQNNPHRKSIKKKRVAKKKSKQLTLRTFFSFIKKIFLALLIIIIYFFTSIIRWYSSVLKQKPIRTIILSLLVVILIFTSSTVYSLYRAYSDASSNSFSLKTSKLREKKTDYSDSFSVLLIGADIGKTRSNQDDFSARADSLIYVTVNIPKNKITLTSIPRDTLAYIPCMDKINKKLDQNYDNYNSINRSLYGGESCVRDTVEGLLQLPVDDYVKVNFEGLIWAVDYLGGITLDITDTFCEQDSHDRQNAYCFKPGKHQKLNGEEALAYARHRHTDSDIFRADRQKQVIEALMTKAGKLNILSEGPTFLKESSKYVETTLDLSELIQTKGLLSSLDNITTENITIEGHDVTTLNSYHYQFNLDSLRQQVSTISKNLTGQKVTPDDYDERHYHYYE